MSTQTSTAGPAGAGVRTPGALRRLHRRAKHGFPASYPLVQFPNVPFIAAATALIVASTTTGTVEDVAQVAFYAALGWWGFLEVTDPANRVRQLLGAAALIYVVVFASI